MLRLIRFWLVADTRPTRQQLGQWFTPEPVADLALSLALHSSASAPDVLLDPSCGDGVFLKSAACRGIDARTLYGVDIDEIAIAEARAKVPGATLVLGDFFEGREMDVPRADIIVGNPPYVRQERVGPDAKQAIVALVLRDWPQLGEDAVRALVGRSDLAAPFVLRLLGQLRENGVAALVLSSAFFDSGYGAEFWALAERVASLRLVVCAPTERWFSEAAVHAVIAVFDAKPSRAPVRFAQLSCPTTEAAAHLAAGGALADVATERVAARSEPETWAAALRASDAWLAFRAEASEVLVPLGELAAVRRGITSGANEIFYLSREQIAKWNIDSKFLTPLLTARGRAGQGAIAVSRDELEQFALVVPKDTSLAEHPDLDRYLKSFPGAETRGTLRNRRPWWALRARPGHVFLCKAYGERFVQPYSATPMVADQRMYSLELCGGALELGGGALELGRGALELGGGALELGRGALELGEQARIAPSLLAALLNATPTALALESLGRASMGQGALEWTVGDVANLPVIDIRKHPNLGAIAAAFQALAKRPSGNVAAEAAQTDRQALDEALLAPWPALAAMRDALSSALVLACAERYARAKSGLR